ncbi:DEAD/DEAH box helicase [Noviherbaspirillum cavernae]|uniref:preprotein translocase subunit SecA n=1 Tax=Noviherbaspirillum cavernae TaxID=2320862 RepID=UPI001314E723|nr:DEAD/DEAH box helicase [Noviherbaspirillum cavernae]
MKQNVVPIPRPGVRFGPYPEQTQTRRPWTWYAAELLRARLLAVRAPSARERARFLHAVHEKRKQLQGCDIEFVSASARRLRSRFAVEGMTRHLVAECFSLIDACLRFHMNITLHDSQLLAGWLMLDRRLVEMQTGEGKTLAVALAAAAGAMAGIPVHVVTANEYLVARDAAALAPVFQTLGLTTGAVTAATAGSDRARIYRCDITYCTASELTFDHLRDQLGAASGQTERNLRGLCMAIIDEADSVLIDEARMPLILSGRVENAEQSAFYRQALFLAAKLKPDEHFKLDHANRRATLTAAGQEHAATLALHMGGAWRVRRRREETLGLALAAQHLFVKGRNYLVRDDHVVIIDETTGRAAQGRVWSQGLHQLIETRENCPLTQEQQTLTQTTFQRFFARYLRVSGISGTLHEARGQLLAIYGLPIVRIPLHLPNRRTIMPARVFATREMQWRHVVDTALALRTQQRPLLIGTDSVADSEVLSEHLSRAGVPHAVLNARFDAEEADIVAKAGQAGAVTVSTNMAGRGTDIRLGDNVAALGGLHVIVCQTNDSRRIDRQLYGRCARQGEPGSVEHLYCMGDGFDPLSAVAERLLRAIRREDAHGLPYRFVLLARAAQKMRERYRRREQWFYYLRAWHTERQLAFAGASD